MLRIGNPAENLLVLAIIAGFGYLIYAGIKKRNPNSKMVNFFRGIK